MNNLNKFISNVCVIFLVFLGACNSNINSPNNNSQPLTNLSNQNIQPSKKTTQPWTTIWRPGGSNSVTIDSMIALSNGLVIFTVQNFNTNVSGMEQLSILDTKTGQAKNVNPFGSLVCTIDSTLAMHSNQIFVTGHNCHDSEGNLKTSVPLTRSQDEGKTWVSVDIGELNTVGGFNLFEDSKGDLFTIGYIERAGDGTQQFIVRSSLDEGLTWKTVLNFNQSDEYNMNGSVDTRCPVDPRDPKYTACNFNAAFYIDAKNRLLVVSGYDYGTVDQDDTVKASNGIHVRVSDDKGLTWKFLAIPNDGNVVSANLLNLVLDPISGNYYVVIREPYTYNPNVNLSEKRSLWVSKDQGVSWQKVSILPDVLPVEQFKLNDNLFVNFGKDGKMYLRESEVDINGIIHLVLRTSLDQGKTWTDLDSFADLDPSTDGRDNFNNFITDSNGVPYSLISRGTYTVDSYLLRSRVSLH